jgi:hypothetical protein
MTVMLSAPTGFNMPITAFRADTKFALPAHGNPYTGDAVAATAKLPLPEVVRAAEQAKGGWPDRLRELAEKTGRPLLADYYRSAPVHVPETGDIAEGTPVPVRALDMLCRPEGYLWWTSSGGGETLFFRKRDWYYQRRLEVPDRWVVALSQRLQAQDSVPTYRDVLTLRELTMDQLGGLNASLGMFSDKRLLAGIPTLLEIVAATPINVAQPLPGGVIAAGSPETRRLSVLPDLANPRIQTLVGEFVASANAPGLTFQKDIKPGAFGFLFHSPSLKRFPPGPDAMDAQGKPRRVPVNVMLYLGESIGAGYMMALPLSLPDDRRDRTKVETMP